MKGFVYLLEIAVTSILIVVILSTFFGIRVKQNWDTSDLIGVGNNIINYLDKDESFFLKVLEKNFTYIESTKPANIGYGVKVRGSPKTEIIVGCTQSPLYQYTESILTPAYVNNRFITFIMEDYDIRNDIPNHLDAIVLINFTNYTIEKDKILKYLDEGGVVIGINATNVNNNADFNEIFGLSSPGFPSGANTFVPYNPSKEDVEKYFMGIGFDVTDEWYIWEERWTVTYGSNYINVSKGGEERNFLNKGETFDLNGHTFKVNRIGSGEANIQATRTGFIFEDFSDLNDVQGNKIVGPGSAASMASNGKAIWISDFPWSDEYRTLVKSAIISRNDEWTARGVYTTRETTTVSSFFSLCCDMTEVSELELTLWYVV
ncbi:MAG: hypothetical protein V1818_04530 [Candidatus Aenigmatarchaeota archaeon]